MPTQTSFLPQLSVKGYRELLKRIRQQSNDESYASGALFQQAKELAVAHLQRQRGSEKLNPRRAFSRLRQRVLDKGLQLKQLKDAKKESLRAKYIALRQQRLATKESAAQAQEVVGSDGFSRAVVLGMVGLLSRGFMTLLNSTEVHGAENLHRALQRADGQGLVTVSNHAAALDDPLLLSAMMPLENLSKPAQYRWGMCATNRCFKNRALTAFFRAGKTLPVERGAGLEQPGMQAAEARLNAGDWVHIFPEGTRSVDGKMGAMRSGVGHLIASCATPPLVLPFVHSGMEKVLPRGSSLPQVGREVQVLVGQPISLADLFKQAQDENWSKRELSLAITQRVAEGLYSLKASLEGVTVPEILREGVPSATSYAEEPEALMPLIEEQIDGLKHSWTQPTLLRQKGSLMDTAFRITGGERKTLPQRYSSLQQQLLLMKQKLTRFPDMPSVLDHFVGRSADLKRLAFS